MTKKGAQTQKWLLLKIAKDDRLQPNKRMLATMLLGFVEGLYPFELIEATYGVRSDGKVNVNEKEEKDITDTEKNDTDAKNALKDLYDEVFKTKEEDAGDSTGIEEGS